MERKMYRFIEDGIETKVSAERWGWGVVYKDGREMKQFGDDGVFHRIGEVQQDRVSLFIMYKLSDPSKRIDMVVTDGMKLIHKYRNTKPSYLPCFVRIYLFGYKLGDQTHYNFILPNDRVIQSSVDNVDLPQFNLTLPKE